MRFDWLSNCRRRLSDSLICSRRGRSKRSGLAARRNGVAETIERLEPRQVLTSLSVSSPSAGEAAGNMVFTISLNDPPTSPILVYFTTIDVGGSGFATSTVDYQQTGGSWLWSPGSAQQLTVSVPLIDDVLDESNETIRFQAYFQSLGGFVTYGDGTIIDNDGPTTPPPPPPTGRQLRIGDAAAMEWYSQPLGFQVTLSAPGAPVTVRYRTENGTAAAGQDYVSITSGTLSWGLNESMPKTIPVMLVNDGIEEPLYENFRVILEAATGASIADGTGVGSITDDDGDTGGGNPNPNPNPNPPPPAATPVIRINDSSISEGNSGTKDLSFTLTLSATSTSPVTVHWRTPAGTAEAGSMVDGEATGDYLWRQGTVQWPAGNKTNKTIKVPIVGEYLVEQNEFFYVRLDNPTGGAVIGDGEAIGTIQNDDGNPNTTVSVAATDATAFERSTETDQLAAFTITRSNNSGQFTVGFDFGGTASSSDYDEVVQLENAITFRNGETSKVVRIRATPDLNDTEGDETVTLSLLDGFGYRVTTRTATATIKDVIAPKASIVATQATAYEASTNADGSSGTPGKFTVSLNQVAQSPVTVLFRLDAASTARATDPNQDYTLSAVDRVVIPAGQQSAEILVNPLADDIQESLETVVLTLLRNGTEYTLQPPAAATVTIEDEGLLVESPDDPNTARRIALTPGCECECLGPNPAPAQKPTDEVALRQDDSAVKTSEPVIVDGKVLPRNPNSVPTSAPLFPEGALPPAAPAVAIPVPTRQVVAMVLKDRSNQVVWSREFVFDVTGKTTGDRVRMGVVPNYSNLDTGVYRLQVTSSTKYSDGSSSANQTVTLDQNIVSQRFATAGSRPDSGLGEGWAMEGLKRLQVSADGVAYLPGDGSIFDFRKNADGSFARPLGLFASLVKTTAGYTLTDKFFTQFKFNNTGRLLTETDRNDRTTDYAYRSDGQLASITDFFGRKVTMTYASTASGAALTSITNADGVVTKVGFNSTTKRLDYLETADPDGSTTSGESARRTEFQYDADGRMSRKAVLENGELESETIYQRDALGNLVSELHRSHDHHEGAEESDHHEEIFTLQSVGGASGMVDARDASAGTAANPASLLERQPLTATRIAPDGSITETETDFRGNVTSQRTLDADGNGPAAIRYRYNNDRLMTRAIHPTVLVGGVPQTLEYLYRYDGNGNLTSLKVQTSSTAANAEWKWTYDSKFGQLEDETDEMGRVTDYQLDTRGNTTKIIEPALNSSLPVVTDLVYFAATSSKRGLLQTQTDPDPDGSGPLLPAVTDFDYDTRGNLTKLTEQGPNGVLVTTFRYFTGTDRLQDITDPLGFISLALSNYTPMGLPTTQTEAVGSATAEAKTVSRYDARGNVVELTLPDPDGTGPLTSTVFAYHYDHHGLLAEAIAPAVSVLQPDGSTATVTPTTHYEYDYRMLLTSVTDALGAVASFEYDARGNLREQWLPDPDGDESAGGGPLDATHYIFDYDDRDRLISHIVEDPDHPGQKLLFETYQHDPLGRVTRVRDELRNANTTFEYDVSGNLRFVTDAEGRKTEYKYDKLGRLEQMVQPDAASASSTGPIWKQGYDALSRLTSRTDPRNNTTNYAYDRLSRLQKVTLPDPDGPTTGSGASARNTLPAPSVEYAYTKLGEIASETDHLLRKTEYKYDRMSRLTTVESPDPDGAGSLTKLTTTTTYDRLGRVIAVLDQRGQTTNYSYNALSWLEQVKSPDPDGAAGSLPMLVTSMAYDANGALRQQTSPGPNGAPLSTTYDRDALGRVITVTAPAPGGSSAAEVSRSRYGYDGLGRAVSITDPLDNVTTYAFDPALRQTRITEPDPDGDGTLDSPGVTTLTFDKVGNLTELKDAANNVTAYKYDRLDRLERETDPFGKARTFAYDDAGNLERRIDRNGRMMKWTYDNLNRPTAERWFATGSSSSTLHSVDWGYNAAGNLATTGETDPDSDKPEVDYLFGYDQLDRLTSVVDTGHFQEPGSSTTRHRAVRMDYAYNSLGDLRQTSAKLNNEATTPTADFVNDYAYDNLGRMTQIVQSGSAGSGQPAITRKRVDLAYSAGGWLSRVIRSTGASGSEIESATSRYSYFANGGLSEIANTHSGAALSGGLNNLPTGSPISAYAWTYDVAGRVSSFTNTLSIGPAAAQGTKSVSYGYDDTHQLTSVTPLVVPPSGGLPSESFDYDETGNRDSQTTSGTTTNTVVDRNRLTSDGKFNYVYDNEGNLKSKTEIATGLRQLFTFDHRNRLTIVEFRTSATAPTNPNKLIKKIELTYDPFDRRVLKRVDETGNGSFDRLERYVYDGDHVSLVLGVSSSVQHRFLHGPAIDQIFADEAKGTTSSASVLNWQLTDNQNTVRDVVNKDGTQLVNHVDYSGFGRITAETDATKTPFFSYTGREYDEDLKLFYYRARYVDPDTNRFLSNDPLGLAAGDVNFQRLVGNSPTNFTDPSGLDTMTLPGRVVRGPVGPPAPKPPPGSLLDKPPLDPVVENPAHLSEVDRYTWLQMMEASAAQRQLDNLMQGRRDAYRYQAQSLLMRGATPEEVSAALSAKSVSRPGKGGDPVAEAFLKLEEKYYQPRNMLGNRFAQDANTPPALRSTAGMCATPNVSGGGRRPPTPPIAPPGTPDEFEGRFEAMNPDDLRFSQRTAGGDGGANELRASLRGGWNGKAVDAVETPAGIVTIDNTRVAVARELRIPRIPVIVHQPSEALPQSMIGRFGPSATWGEALQYRTSTQRPPLPGTGTSTPPKLPRADAH